ncbi:unnamed protein product [Cunninghamella blakesleeana]
MSFLDTMIYSFSNMFSIGPDMYMDDEDECCQKNGSNGMCCKNMKSEPKKIKEQDAILTCAQKQQLYNCHCPSEYNTTNNETVSIKLISCGNNMKTTTWPIPLLNQFFKDREHTKVCTILLDEQSSNSIFNATSICIFLLSDIKSNDALDRLMGWMNEQIILSTQPLQHLKYGIILINDDLKHIGSAFEQKLKQLGATEVQPMFLTTLQHNDDMKQWVGLFVNKLDSHDHQYNHLHHKDGINYDPSVIASAGCTNGMVDVEDMGQVARKIKEVKRKKADREALVKRRGRAKRMVGIDLSHINKASPTTELSTIETSVSMKA